MSPPENDPKESRSVVLLLHCPLRLGLAAGLTQFVYTHGGRILYHEQYVDAEIGHYYTRLEWDVSSFSMTDGEMAGRLRDVIGDVAEIEWSLHSSDEVARMAVFVSKDPWCLYDTLARKTFGQRRVRLTRTHTYPSGVVELRYERRGR
jgi:formyltetrahydrofolate deformylase